MALLVLGHLALVFWSGGPFRRAATLIGQGGLLRGGTLERTVAAADLPVPSLGPLPRAVERPLHPGLRRSAADTVWVRAEPA